MTLTWEGDTLRMHDAQQLVAHTAWSMAHVFGINEKQVVVTSPFVGGGFGSKSMWQHHILAAAAAKLAGRPVRIVLSREGVFRVVGGRSPTEQRVALGANAEGKLTALIHQGVTVKTPHNAMPEPFILPSRSAYAAETMLLDVQKVELDMLGNTFMRTPGEAVGTFALECAIDELAEKLGIDPVELRIRNEPDKDPLPRLLRLAQTGRGGGLPNTLTSSFGGPAWTLDPLTGEYYLHLFSRRQPDLNWENPKVRAEIYKMMNWWLERGIAGFRMDVIDYIGKQVDQGIVTDGAHLHDYLQEMHRETFGSRDVLTVGETWSATPGSALLYSGRDRGELSMVFQFEHVTQQWDEVYGKWRSRPFDLVKLKSVLSKWQYALAADGWNSLFWGNHDLPRAVSKYGDVKGYPVESAKMLATVLHLLKGTPFVYQGEEIGMTNVSFGKIEQYRDIETLNMHRIHLAAGLSPEEFI